MEHEEKPKKVLNSTMEAFKLGDILAKGKSAPFKDQTQLFFTAVAIGIHDRKQIPSDNTKQFVRYHDAVLLDRNYKIFQQLLKSDKPGITELEIQEELRKYLEYGIREIYEIYKKSDNKINFTDLRDKYK